MLNDISDLQTGLGCQELLIDLPLRGINPIGRFRFELRAVTSIISFECDHVIRNLRLQNIRLSVSGPHPRE